VVDAPGAPERGPRWWPTLRIPSGRLPVHTSNPRGPTECRDSPSPLLLIARGGPGPKKRKRPFDRAPTRRNLATASSERLPRSQVADQVAPAAHGVELLDTLSTTFRLPDCRGSSKRASIGYLTGSREQEVPQDRDMIPQRLDRWERVPGPLPGTEARLGRSWFALTGGLHRNVYDKPFREEFRERFSIMGVPDFTPDATRVDPRQRSDT